ncbi:MAG: hypothetical protein OEW45_23645 [Deltaproteobacteria bacterium]|nr:hypothetical protein [Deltaproteobacteria bacterium]
MIGSIIGGIICIIGGLCLFLIKAAGSESLLVPISPGIGIYCIGKGIYIIFQGVQLRGIKNLVERDNKVWSRFVEAIQENSKIGVIVERIYQRYHIAGLGRIN